MMSLSSKRGSIGSSMGAANKHITPAPHNFRSQSSSSPPLCRRGRSNRLLLGFGAVVVSVYLAGLRHGLQTVRTIENDTADKIWASFLDLFEYGGADGRDDDGRDGLSIPQDDDGTGTELETETLDVDPTSAAGEARVDPARVRAHPAAMGTSGPSWLSWSRRRPLWDHAAPKSVAVLHPAPPHLRLPKPIINVGFPKAGTSTIFSFFHCNGLRAQHWLCCDRQDHPAVTERSMLMSRCMIENNIAGRPILGGCGDFDVYTEINGPRNFVDHGRRTLLDDGTLLPLNMSRGTHQRLFFPQHHLLDKIHDQYPNATLVLNQRPAAAWVKSVLKWNSNLEWEILNEFFHQNATRAVLFPSPQPGGGDEEGGSAHPPYTSRNVGQYLLTVYNYHLNFIRSWVEKHPSHALVEVDITHDGAGRVLAEAFGLSAACWGHFNRNTEDGRKRRFGPRGRMAGGGMRENGQPRPGFGWPQWANGATPLRRKIDPRGRVKTQ